METARPVVVFDLDGTLTRKDISIPFLGFTAGGRSTLMGLISAGAWAIPDWSRAVAAERSEGQHRVGGVLGRWEGLLHERVVARTLRGRSRSELETAAERFAHAKLPDTLRADVRERLDRHVREGHRLVLASASLVICLGPLREILGFDTVVGTRLEFQDGVATGRFEGLPCWGDEKLRRVRAILRPGEEILHAYGDSRGDRALLRAAQNSTLVR